MPGVVDVGMSRRGPSKDVYGCGVAVRVEGMKKGTGTEVPVPINTGTMCLFGVNRN